MAEWLHRNAGVEKGDWTLNCFNSVFELHHHPTKCSAAHHIEHILIETKELFAICSTVLTTQNGEKFIFESATSSNCLAQNWWWWLMRFSALYWFFTPIWNEPPAKIMWRSPLAIRKYSKLPNRTNRERAAKSIHSESAELSFRGFLSNCFFFPCCLSIFTATFDTSIE